jgi:hypothetical protein
MPWARRPEGGVAITGQLYGSMGERALTAIQAYTTYDGPDDRRRSEQRAADALDSIFEVALRSGTAPTQHGVRPHIRAHVQWSDLVAGVGTAELAGLGPVTIDELRPLLDAVPAVREAWSSRRTPGDGHRCSRLPVASAGCVRRALRRGSSARLQVARLGGTLRPGGMTPRCPMPGDADGRDRQPDTEPTRGRDRR